MVTDGKRSGDVVSTGDGRDTVPIEFVGASSPWVGDVEMEIRGELPERSPVEGEVGCSPRFRTRRWLTPQC